MPGKNVQDKNDIAPVDLVQSRDVMSDDSFRENPPSREDSSFRDEPLQNVENTEPSLDADSQVQAQKLIRYRFKFHGNAREFFGIWIVNILLTIVTLGAYSAWAKVRQTRYLYGNLEFADSRFQYLAEPKAILRGRLIALILLAPYIYFSYVDPQLAGVIFIGLLLIAPILIVLANRFRFHNTAYRNIRFRFSGTIGEAYMYYTVLPVFAVFTFGLAIPAVIKAQREFKMNNTAWGANYFSTQASYGFFYSLMFLLLAVMLISGLALALGFGFLAGMNGALEFLQLFSFVPGMLFYVFILHYFNSSVFQHMLERSEIAGAKFETFQIKPGTYANIQATNLLAIIFTAGLAYPWAKIRSLTYLTENISVLSKVGMEHIVQADTEESNAISEEVANMYELDLGL